jgi:hypothetical protein
VAETAVGDMYRIGESRVDNLRLKPREAILNPPGISLLRAPSPTEAARQICEAFPSADALHEAVQVIGSTTVDNIRQAGFDVLPHPTKKLPNHYRLIHPEGVTGFHDVNLARLSAVFTETSGHAV